MLYTTRKPLASSGATVLPRRPKIVAEAGRAMVAQSSPNFSSVRAIIFTIGVVEPIFHEELFLMVMMQQVRKAFI